MLTEILSITQQPRMFCAKFKIEEYPYVRYDGCFAAIGEIFGQRILITNHAFYKLWDSLLENFPKFPPEKLTRPWVLYYVFKWMSSSRLAKRWNGSEMDELHGDTAMYRVHGKRLVFVLKYCDINENWVLKTCYFCENMKTRYEVQYMGSPELPQTWIRS